MSYLSEHDYLSFTPNKDGEIATAEYFYFNQVTDEEQEESEDLVSLEGLRVFLESKEIEYCSVSIAPINEAFEEEYNKLLKELDKNESSYLKPAWDFAYGFGNVLDPLAGVYIGWSFYIDTSDHLPNIKLINDVFSKSEIIQRLMTDMENIFDSTISIDGCLTG
jgi:hypothetical protein